MKNITQIVWPSSNMDQTLESFLEELEISDDENKKVFKAYQTALNKSKEQIIQIIEWKYEKDKDVENARIAYKIQKEFSEKQKDIWDKVKTRIEEIFKIKHEKKVA